MNPLHRAAIERGLALLLHDGPDQTAPLAQAIGRYGQGE